MTPQPRGACELTAGPHGALVVSERCGADIGTDGTAGFVTAQLQRANITREITAGRDGVPCGGRGLQADVACSEVTGATWTPPATPPVCPLPGRCQQGARCWNVRRVLVLPRGDAQPCHCASEKTAANRNGRENSLLGLESQFCWTAPRGAVPQPQKRVGRALVPSVQQGCRQHKL